MKWEMVFSFESAATYQVIWFYVSSQSSALLSRWPVAIDEFFVPVWSDVLRVVCVRQSSRKIGEVARLRVSPFHGQYNLYTVSSHRFRNNYDRNHVLTYVRVGGDLTDYSCPNFNMKENDIHTGNREPGASNQSSG